MWVIFAVLLVALIVGSRLASDPEDDDDEG
jgi:hypothetical protein